MVNPDVPPHSFEATTTKSYGEAEDFVHNKLMANILDFPKPDGVMEINAKRHILRNSVVWSCSYAAPVTLRFYEGDYYRIQFHRRGTGATFIDGKPFEVRPDQAVVSTAPVDIHFGQDFQQIVLRIKKSMLHQKLSTLTGLPIKRPLEFDRSFDPQKYNARFFCRMLEFMVDDEKTDRSIETSIAWAEIEESWATFLLQACPNNYSSLLARQEGNIAPSLVCLVEDYMEANWHKPINIEDIAALTDSSIRSVFRSFSVSRGYSPMAFLKQVRLKQARKMLVTPGNHLSVSQIAGTCGFLNLGRFSQEYYQVYNEFPSNTLKRFKN